MRSIATGARFYAIGQNELNDIFLSYNREDAAVAKRFADGFAAEGLSVWWDATLRSGEAYDEVTEAALRGAKAVVVLWSPRSVVSRWVRAEATIADRCKTLVPVMIEFCERPIMFELTQTAELAHWTGDTSDRAWRAFLADLQFIVGTPLAPRKPEPYAPALASPQLKAKPNVLILPFVNMGGDAEQEYFSDGVTEDIMTDLGRVAALSLVSRNMAFSFKGKTVATAHLAEMLHVSHILEGSVRKSGDRVRITAQLMDAATDTQVWAERFDRTLNDIFAIQDDISKAVVAALKLHLAPDEQRAIERRPTSNPEAYELFLMARQFGRTGSERMKPLIVRLCQRVVEIDPGFALAWAHLSFAEAELSQRNVAGFTIENALASAQRALEVDPDLAEAHAAMAEALVRGANEDLSAGEPSIITALRLDPDCFEANLFAGYVYLSQSKWAEAVHYYEIACALDQDAYRPAGMVVQAYNGLGDQDNALAAARRTLSRCEKILAVEPDHGGALGFFVNALAETGEADRAREWTRRAVLFDPDNIRLHYNLACAMATLGDATASCDLLDGVISKVNVSWLLWIDIDNSLDPIRSHPRFTAVIEKIAQQLKLLTN